MLLRHLSETASYRVIAALAFGAVTAPAFAQDAPRELPAVSVEGAQPFGGGTEYKVDNPSSPKLTEPLRNTPQSIDVVPAQMIEDRGVTTLNDAIRTVPGVSIAAGEGGNQGSSFTLRGFSARNDIFLDGMRDFGSYYRDAFNLDAVEVLKGPSSMLFGRGSTGGVVNQVSKAPELRGFTAGSAMVGTDHTLRVTADVDAPIQALKGGAFRLNLMANDNEVAERDVGEYKRFAVAPSLALGLGTPTRFNLNYFHQNEADIPDYGMPIFFGGVPNVKRDNFYGFTSDYLFTTADIATAKVEHDATDWLTLRNQLRFANYTRDFRITEPQLPGSATPATPLQNIVVTRNMIAGDSVETFLQNQTDGTLNFSTGMFGHTVVTGVEIGRETSDPTRYNQNNVTGANFLNPNPSIFFSNERTVRTNAHGEAKSVAFYAVDTVKIGEQWEVSGGGRFDHIDSHYEENAAHLDLDRRDDLASWRAGLVYKPLPVGSIYFGWGTSFNPSVESLSLSLATVDTPPEKNETYEIGTKWDLFNERLSLRGAVFRTDKTNSRVPDPNNTLLMVLGGSQRVDGFEVEANGRVTDKMQLFVGYTHMEGEVTKAPPNASPREGAPLQNTPMHTFHAWTTYDLPYRFQVGGGVNWVSERVARNTPSAFANNTIVPGYVTWDLMGKYRLTDTVDIQLNILNLFDRFYIDQMHPNHLVPGAGRTLLLTTAFKF